MSFEFPAKPLAEIADAIDYGVTASASTIDTGTKFLRITDIQDGNVDWASVPYCDGPPNKLRSAALSDGDIVFARTGATTGKSFLIKSPPSGAVFASYLIRVRPSTVVDPAYLAHFFQSKGYWGQIQKRTQGAAQGGVNATSLSEIEIPLPPLAEQRRIAAILDKADALRRKRRQAIDLLGSLTQSIFLEMFGDAKHLPTKPLGKALSRPLRNGLSPAKSGSIKSKVLTLSAITGKVFKADAVKEADFTAESPASQRVAEGDFLICRGNGNKSLVGIGVTAPFSMPDTTFPDTIIAGRIDDHWFDSHYFEHVWNSPVVRRQIEQSARTTNGTFKVNQQVLERVEIPLPDSRLQTEFGLHVTSINSQLARNQKQLEYQHHLFASLQSRAFSGQL